MPTTISTSWAGLVVLLPEKGNPHCCHRCSHSSVLTAAAGTCSALPRVQCWQGRRAAAGRPGHHGHVGGGQRAAWSLCPNVLPQSDNGPCAGVDSWLGFGPTRHGTFLGCTASGAVAGPVLQVQQVKAVRRWRSLNKNSLLRLGTPCGRTPHPDVGHLLCPHHLSMGRG